MKNELKAKDEAMISSGVDQLIQRLRDDGVAAGRSEAAQLIAEAREKAGKILAEAEQQAQDTVASARQEAEKIRRGGEDALNIAMRDIVLKLKAQLSDVVGERVRRLIATELQQEAFLQSLILEIAGKVRKENRLDECEGLTVLLPRDLIGIEELRHHPLELEEGSLSHFIINVAADVLREGVTFAPSADGRNGLLITLNDRDVQIDFTDERISSLLLEHLQPRFRAILEGMVR